MKKRLALSGVMAIALLISCNNSKKEEPPAPSPVPQQTPPPPAPASQQTAPPPAEQKEGTTIKVNDNGVSVENKEGNKKNNVSISKDSASIEIRKPK